MEKNYNAQSEEARISQKWLTNDAFKAGANRSRDESFSILLPPPNVTGVLHMGHAFNQTLMDILIRWHRMRGFDTLWQPGLDHAGIATQMVVERELAKNNEPSRRKLGREKFLDKVWEWKEQSGGTIIEQSKRLGTSMDWSRNAFTMDENFQRAVIQVFVDMYHKGLIYRGKRLVNWDPHFETAISDLEVENIEVQGHMWHFKYPLADGESYIYIEKDEDGNVVLEEKRDYISIATTRPETMLGDGAVAVHPDDERYAPIIGKLCEIPVGPKEHRRLIPIITDEYPDPDFGSGAVKITGAHDFNDYQVAKRGNIPMYNLMDTKGALRADGRPYADEAADALAISRGEMEWNEALIASMNLVPDEYRGLDREEARKRVVADIDAEGLMIKIEDKPIMQPFGDRSKVVIEPMLTDQWFVDSDAIVGPAIEAVEKGEVKIIPEQDKKVYFNWLKNIEPWCISRQLWWGHQIPVWYDEDGQEYCAATKEDAQKLAAGKALTRDPDVLDTWFSSGLWPIGTLGWPEETEELQRYFPTSVLITGFDIIFFWVARMMMMQYAVVGEKPFSTVYVHALVRDEKGKKMSKSLGNVLDPLELIDDFGADAVRFTLASMAAMGRDLKLSVSRIEGYRNFGTKIWNAARFAEMNEGFAPQGFDPQAPKARVNKWIIGETAKARMAMDQALEEYRFNEAASAIYAYSWNVVCDWYLEFSKPLLNGEDEALKAETRATLGWVIDQMITLLHPVMPYITESIWEARGHHENMLVHQNWPEFGAELVDEEASQEMNWVINLIERIRSTRAELHVPAGKKLILEKIELDAEHEGYLERNLPLIMRLARIEELVSQEEASQGAVAVPVEGGGFALPLAGVVDVHEEIARLQKSIDKLSKETGALEGRLNNPKFVESAPQEVVEEARARLLEAKDEASKLATAQERMKGLL